MADEDLHGRCVNAWMERVDTGSPPEPLLRAFEQAFAALWLRAHRTLGEVTLAAVVERVLSRASDRYPVLSPLEVGPAGLRCDGLLARAGSARHERLAEGIRFVLVELLTVLGNLTADILTPALHAELSKAATDAGRAAKGRKASPRAAKAATMRKRTS